MESRGPDSAGFAIYKKEKKEEFKYSICINNLAFEKFKKENNSTPPKKNQKKFWIF